MAEFRDELKPLLDSAYEMVAVGDLDQAWVLLGRLEGGFPDSPEVPALMGDIWMNQGDLDYALELYDRAVEIDPEWSDGYTARANCLAELGQTEEAWSDVERALELDPDNPEAHFVKAILLEIDRRFRKAEEEYLIAHRLDPDGFGLPVRVTRREFDRVVTEAIQRLPKEFKDRMLGVQVFVADMPDPSLTVDGAWQPLILGLFDGPMTTEMTMMDAVPTPPPKIHLFQRNIERMCRSRDELLEEIEVTLQHEVGHYFGLDEDRLERVNLR